MNRWNPKIVAKVSYTDGFIKGFKLGQQITEVIAQHDAIVAMAFFVLGSVVAVLTKLV